MCDEKIPVRVICWDGVEYYRKTTYGEIEKYKKEGYAKYINGELTFDFR